MRKVALDKVHELARKDPRVLFIGSDLGAGTLSKMQAEMPDRWFMEGISEAGMIGMAAGMAMEGFVPYLNTIAPFFTRRANEQIAIDVCLHNLPVRLIASGGGVVYSPLGPTHLAIEDMGAMRLIPNMTVVAPCDAQEMGRLMDASINWPGPIYIRLGKGGDPIVSDPAKGFAIGKAIVAREPGDILMVTTGVMLGRAMVAAEALAAEGIHCGILHAHTVKPLDGEALTQYAAKAKLVVTIEEHTKVGGLGSAVMESLSETLAKPVPVLRLALPDAYPKQYGSQDEMLESYGLQPPQIAESIRQKVAKL